MPISALYMETLTPFTPPASSLLTSLPPPSQSNPPFPLLHLPLELRQQIYTHLLPRTLLYRAPTCTPHRWAAQARQRKPPPSFLPLFLTSRQVAHESAEVLWRTCIVRVETGRRRKISVQRQWNLVIRGLEAWDQRARGGVRRVERGCEGVVFYLPLPTSSASSLATSTPWTTASSSGSVWAAAGYHWHPQHGWLAKEGSGDVDVLFAMYCHLVAEARVFATYLPQLREFLAAWPALENGVMMRFGDFIPAYGCVPEEERGESVRRLRDALVAWLRGCVGDGRFNAPDVLRIRFGKRTNEVESEEDRWRRAVMRDALAAAQREVATAPVVAEELEGSGQRWLEGLSGTRKRGRRGWVEVE